MTGAPVTSAQHMAQSFTEPAPAADGALETRAHPDMPAWPADYVPPQLADYTGEVVWVSGYALRFGEAGMPRLRSGQPSDGGTEVVPGPETITNLTGLRPPLLYGHHGRVLCERAEWCGVDAYGVLCTWALDPVPIPPDVLAYVTRAERGLSIEGLAMPPIVIGRTDLLIRGEGVTATHTVATSIQIDAVAVVLPGEQPAYDNARTICPAT